ncbi:Protein FANTASTIC FOUR 3 [Acorus gramineus]|uniref:Protein FANTASTIC FOUR 3 n=1 Tax=Acorus gramineus TaxID=55184 RepID=A0AAV9BNX5_ACOGR|nr:Protein FANTASTIC FOUR 3 [Acorus gramineus]
MTPPTSTTAFAGQSYTFFPTKPIKGDAFGGWSAIQPLIKPPTQNPPSQTETKTTFRFGSQPTSTMSEESLAMCTEGLGCETGVVYVDEDMLGTLSSPPSPPPPPFLRRQRPPKVAEREFPPPMKSIEAVKYVKHREGERLVVKAVRASTMLKADRSGGRVRLCYLKCVDVPPPVEEEEEEEEEEDDEDEEEEDMNENNKSCGEEIGMENYGRVLPWERFLVAST